MSGKRHMDEFKMAAVKQVSQRGHSVGDVAERLGVSIHSLYAWVKRYGDPEAERKAVDAQSDEFARMQAVASGIELTGERPAPKQMMHVGNARIDYRGASIPVGVRTGRNISEWEDEK